MSLAHAVLTMVRAHERHAYEITTLLSRLVPGPPYNQGHIHGTMAQLETRGHVTSRYVFAGRNRKRLYRITPRGHQAWARWRARPLPRPRPTRDEVLLRTVVVGLDDPRLLETVLQDYGSSLRPPLEAFDSTAVELAACESRSELLLTLASLLVCFRQQADLRWVELCLERIQTLADMPQEVRGETSDDPDYAPVAPALRTSNSHRQPPSSRRSRAGAPNGDDPKTRRASSGESPLLNTRG